MKLCLRPFTGGDFETSGMLFVSSGIGIEALSTERFLGGSHVMKSLTLDTLSILFWSFSYMLPEF